MEKLQANRSVKSSRPIPLPRSGKGEIGDEGADAEQAAGMVRLQKRLRVLELKRHTGRGPFAPSPAQILRERRERRLGLQDLLPATCLLRGRTVVEILRSRFRPTAPVQA